MYWYDAAGNRIDAAQASALLADTAARRVALTEIGDWRVSTVFLVLDHGLGRGERPVLWETMVFEGDDACDLYQQRYTSAVAALAGHDQAVAWLRGHLDALDEVTQPRAADATRPES